MSNSRTVQPFDAQAAKWNLDKLIERGTGSPADWTSIDVLDDFTLRINLKTFKNTQLSGMTYAMISPTAVQKHGMDWAKTNPVGTGPFKMKQFIRDTSMEFERFNDYWGDKARLDGIKYIYISDETTAEMAFRSNSGQVLEGAAPRIAADLQKEGYKIRTRRGPLMNLVPDSKNADSPFADIKGAGSCRICHQSTGNRQKAWLWLLGGGKQPDAPEQFGHIP